MAQVSLGLDIGSYSIKVAQLAKQRDNFVISGLGYTLIKDSGSANLAPAIKEALRQLKVATRKVNATIFSQGAVVRYVSLPLMGQKELTQAMDFEMERYVPFKPSDAFADYQILKEDPVTRNMKVLMVAAKKEVVNSRVALIEEAGLDPQLISLDSILLKNVFSVNYPPTKDTTVAVINIGAKTTNINIIRDNISYFIRDVQIGGENFTALIMEKFSLDKDAAENLKVNPGKESDNVFKTIEPVMGNLVNEIYLSFDYYESEFGMVIDEVYLCGGSARLVWLKTFLEENLTREIALLEPFKKITVTAGIQKDRLDVLAPSFAVATGLCLESFF